MNEEGRNEGEKEETKDGIIPACVTRKPLSTIRYWIVIETVCICCQQINNLRRSRIKLNGPSALAKHCKLQIEIERRERRQKCLNPLSPKGSSFDE